jgi:hypothetical protein
MEEVAALTPLMVPVPATPSPSAAVTLAAADSTCS